MTTMETCRPHNLNTPVKLDVESDSSVKKIQFLCLDRAFYENHNLWKIGKKYDVLIAPFFEGPLGQVLWRCLQRKTTKIWRSCAPPSSPGPWRPKKGAASLHPGRWIDQLTLFNWMFGIFTGLFLYLFPVVFLLFYFMCPLETSLFYFMFPLETSQNLPWIVPNTP